MRVCVFCGSASGHLPVYSEMAAQLGQALADAAIGLVYGGASVGLMGVVADAALSRGGEVIGVIPQALAGREIAHEGLSALHVVDSMHTRKAMMAELSDAFVALPGGAGTLEEIFEVWTWAQLGYHGKPCALLNVQGYYDGLLAFLDGVVAQGFLRPAYREMLIVATTPQDLLARLRDYQPPAAPKWVQHGGR
ncbi:MAG: TIGR00730 family Rossman fold protein [Lautropia sp.]|nr:TIGR00730 family Rossman fold protein [Lautropia sp.]